VMPASVLARAMASLEPSDASTATMILLMTVPFSRGDGTDGRPGRRSGHPGETALERG
jgi:hypothetical protein